MNDYKTVCLKRSVLAGFALTGLCSLSALGQEAEDTLNRFRISYRPGFNISASFKELITISPAISGIDHEYIDGYNRVDNTGNRQHYTWYWGIENVSQAPGDGYLYLHNIDAGNVKDQSDDPQHGAELTYNRQLGTIGNCKWGLEAAVNYTSVDIESSFAGNVNLVTDAYQFPFTYPWLASGSRVYPQNIPYHGTYYPKYGSDTPLLSDIPNRSFSTAGSTAYRELDADLYGLRLGPYLELPLSKKFAVGLSGGLALAYIDSDFSFQERVINPEIVRRGTDNKTDILVGGFVSGTISYNFNRTWSIFAGAQYQHLGNFNQKANNKEAELDLGTSVFVSVGLGYSF